MSLRNLIRSTLLGSALVLGAARAQTAPSIDSVVNAANFKAGALGAGGWVSLTGSGLSPCTKVDTAQPIKLVCDTGEEVMVTANGLPLPLYYASPGQLNVLAPSAPGKYDVVGSVNGLQSKPVSVSVSTSNIAVFNNYHLAATINQNGTVHWYNNPARPGDIVSVYANAGGPTVSTEQVQAGPQTVTIEHTEAPSVTIEGQSAPVLFAGKAYGYKGLWQYNIKLPDSLPAGAHTMTFCLENTCDSADVLVGAAQDTGKNILPVPVPLPHQYLQVQLSGSVTTAEQTTQLTSSGNYLIPATAGNVVLAVDGQGRYANLNRTVTFEQAAAIPVPTLLPELVVDTDAKYQFVQTRGSPDNAAAFWQLGGSGMNNRDFALYSNTLAQFCTSSPINTSPLYPQCWNAWSYSNLPITVWKELPVQVTNIDQAPTGKAWLNSTQVEIRDELRAILQAQTVNGRQGFVEVSQCDPNKPCLEFKYVDGNQAGVVITDYECSRESQEGPCRDAQYPSWRLACYYAPRARAWVGAFLP